MTDSTPAERRPDLDYTKFVDIVFTDGARPGPDLTFVEVENDKRAGIGWLGEWVDREDGYRVYRIQNETKSPVEDLQVSWLTMVTYRDLAIENGDFERSIMYSYVLEDLAIMIKSTGADLPDLPKAGE